MEVAMTELLTQDQVAELLSVTPGTLANKRSTGEGPKFIKLCGKIKYRKIDVEAFINSHAVRTSTSQEAAA
jgi:hypothetical protein